MNKISLARDQSSFSRAGRPGATASSVARVAGLPRGRRPARPSLRDGCVEKGARTMTVGRSSFSGWASEHWSASWEIATCRVARVAATPGGARCRSALEGWAFLCKASAGGDSQKEILSASSGLCRANPIFEPQREIVAFRLGVASAVMGKSRPSFGLSRSRCEASPSSAWGRGCPVRVPSGTAPEDEFLCGRGGQLNNCIPMECPPSPEARARALFSPRHPDRAETYKETDEPTYT